MEVKCPEMVPVLDRHGKPKKENGKELEQPCDKVCEPKGVAQFTSITFECPEGHKHTLKMDKVQKSERMCAHCAKDNRREYMIFWGLAQRQEPPSVVQDYHYKCLECGEVWVEEVVVRRKDAYRFRKAPTVEMEVAS